MFETQFEEGVKIVSVLFEVVWCKSQEGLEDVESSEDRVDVRILEELPNINLEIGPSFIILGNEGAGYLPDRVSDVLFHAHVGFHIDDFKESQFDGLLHL